MNDWIRKHLKQVVHSINRVRVGFASLFTPSNTYIQQAPDLFTLNGRLQEFNSQSSKFHKHRPRVLGDSARVAMIMMLLERVREIDSGDYAELGTYKGDTARIIFEMMSKNSQLMCFDTFEGFDERNVEEESEVSGLKTKSGHFSDTSISRVVKNITGTVAEHPNLKIVKGFFPESFEQNDSHKWKFVHLDADLYAPMKAGIETFYPQMVKGGIMLIHDYNGGYVGTKKAIDEYCLPREIQIIPMPDKVGSAIIVKT